MSTLPIEKMVYREGHAIVFDALSNLLVNFHIILRLKYILS